MDISLITDSTLFSCSILNEASFPTSGHIILKTMNGNFIKCLPFVNDPFEEKGIIRVPIDLVNYQDKCLIEVLNETVVPVAEKLVLEKVHTEEAFDINDDITVYTFTGDIIHSYKEGKMNIFKVQECGSLSKITSETLIEYTEKKEAQTAKYFDELLENVESQIKGKVSFIFGLPKVLERLAWKKIEHKFDLSPFLNTDESEKEISVIDEFRYGVFHAEFLEQKSIDRLLDSIINSKSSFIFFMGIASESHPLVCSFEKYILCQKIHFQPLNIERISQVLQEYQVASINPTLLAGLSLDSILSIIKKSRECPLDDLVRKAQEEHWKNFGVVLNPSDYSWKKVIGYANEIAQLRNYIFAQYLKPEKFKALRLKAPKGILLYGPTGCGKTLFARTLAADKHCTVIEIRTVLLYSKYFGETEERIRQVFANARQRTPCVLVFDEFEGLGMKRNLGDSGDTTGVAVRVLTTLLNELDGVQELEGVTVVGCTNRKEVIDEALLRPGRMDVHIEIGFPSESDLQLFVSYYLESHHHNFNLSQICNSLKGKTFGQVKMIIDNAALYAYVRKSPIMEMQDFEKAIKE